MRFTEKDDFLGYAIPQTNAVGDKQINIALLGKSDNLDEASVTVICQNYIVGEPIRQFGRIEDVLEKHDVGSAEELDLILEGLAKVHQENANLKNELAELKQKAIVPKFRTYQPIFYITQYYTSTKGNPEYDIISDKYYVAENENEIILGWNYAKDFNQRKYYYVRKDWVFPTLEEAEQKLTEIKGEKSE